MKRHTVYAAGLVAGLATLLMPGALLAQPSTAPPPEPTRRPSMVGYIEDSTIATGFRIRFDDDSHIHDPDRAEFFYAKCGCYWGLPTSNPFYDPAAPGNRSGIATDLNAQQVYLRGEYALPSRRMSLFAELPIRWLQPQVFGAGTFGNESGLSDLQIGAKLDVMSRGSGQATALLRVTTPTGDPAKGLGTDHVSIEPALILARDIGTKAGIEGEFGAVLPVGGSPGLPTSSSEKFAGSVLYYGIGPSFDVYSNGRTRVTPVVELVGWRVLGGFQTGDPALTTGPDAGFAKASDAAPNIVNLKVGARVTLPRASSVYVGYGKHLTDAMWYDQIFRVEYRVDLGR